MLSRPLTHPIYVLSRGSPGIPPSPAMSLATRGFIYHASLGSPNQWPALRPCPLRIPDKSHALLTQPHSPTGFHTVNTTTRVQQQTQHAPNSRLSAS